MTDDDKARYLTLVKRLRMLGSMNQHEQDEEAVMLYATELEEITRSLAG